MSETASKLVSCNLTSETWQVWVGCGIWGVWGVEYGGCGGVEYGGCGVWRMGGVGVWNMGGVGVWSMGGVGYRDMYSGKFECFTPKHNYFHLSVQAKLTN